MPGVSVGPGVPGPSPAAVNTVESGDVWESGSGFTEPGETIGDRRDGFASTPGLTAKLSPASPAGPLPEPSEDA